MLGFKVSVITVFRTISSGSKTNFDKMKCLIKHCFKLSLLQKVVDAESHPCYDIKK